MASPSARVALGYFPGHMARALRELRAAAQTCDFAIEVLDARAPSLSRNAKAMRVFASLPVFTLAVRADLAGPSRSSGVRVDAKAPGARKAILSAMSGFLELAAAKQRAAGIPNPALVGVVVGAPNVGKSTVINALARRKAAVAQNRPGVTRSQQRVRVAPDLELLDTPGVLPPSVGDESAKHALVVLNLLPADAQEARDALAWLFARRPALLGDAKDADQWLDAFGKKRGLLRAGGTVDADQAALAALREVGAGKMGPLSLD